MPISPPPTFDSHSPLLSHHTLIPLLPCSFLRFLGEIEIRACVVDPAVTHRCGLSHSAHASLILFAFSLPNHIKRRGGGVEGENSAFPDQKNLPSISFYNNQDSRIRRSAFARRQDGYEGEACLLPHATAPQH